MFGFPNSPALPITGQNLGFLDQRFALDWVQQNIYAFGGNPTKVTIFGESAGAESVDALVNSFPKNPPFRAAIMESGTQELEIFESLGTNSEASWLNLTASLRCTTLACVRAAPATTIKSIIENFALPFRPVIDGVTFIANATAARIAGNVARVPILEGTNGQEGRVFVVGMTNLTAFISTDFGFSPALAAQVAQAYAIGTEGTTSGFEAIAQLYTELVFQCVRNPVLTFISVTNLKHSRRPEPPSKPPQPVHLSGATSSTPPSPTSPLFRALQPSTPPRSPSSLAPTHVPMTPRKNLPLASICAAHGRALRGIPRMAPAGMPSARLTAQIWASWAPMARPASRSSARVWWIPGVPSSHRFILLLASKGEV